MHGYEKHSRAFRAGLFGGLLAVLGAGCADAGSASAKGPNVLLITVDSLRADRLGCYGYARDTTPNLDRLAEQGTVFERAFAHAPFTPPAHASLLTGLNVKSHGILGWQETLGPEARTLAERFAERGWRTGAFYNHPALARSNVARGFDEVQVRYFEEADLTVDAFLDWLGAGPGEAPFCAWLHLWDVHRPYGFRDWRPDYAKSEVERDELTLAFAETTFGEPTSLDVGRDESYYNLTPAERAEGRRIDGAMRKLGPRDWQYLEDRYDSGVHYADRGLGRLFDALRERGLLDDTIVVVTADHGEALREREACWFTHDPFLFDETLRVPLIVRWPAGRFAGRRESALVRHVDVLPTLLEVADLPLSGSEQGLSLAGLLEGRRQEMGPLLASTQTLNPKESDKPAGATGWFEERRALVVGDLKLVRDDSRDAWALFDRASDPLERRDLAADPAWREQLAELRERLEELSAALPEAGAASSALDLETQALLNGLGYAGAPASAQEH